MMTDIKVNWWEDTNISSPKDYGAKLHINTAFITDPNLPISVDVETDENGKFVGIAICQDEKDVYYSTDIFNLKSLVGHEFIMQGGKFDIRELRSWGINVDYDNLIWDTSIMAYCYDTTLKSYSLKKIEKGKRVGLIEQFLPELKWLTYKEMVGVGKKKVTLDKQPVERAAKYCGMDALATFKLKFHLKEHMSEHQLAYYTGLEMPIYRLLARMEDKGIRIDKQHLANVGEQLLEKQMTLEQYFNGQQVNPRSPKQLLEWIGKLGINEKKTDVATLQKYKDLPEIEKLLRYRKYKKIHSTYVKPYLQLEGDRIHPNFTQSTITGRLACNKPNLQNLPAPDPELKRFDMDMGTLIREAFIADEGEKLLALDYSQIEYRLLAHFSKEDILLEAFKKGEDVHEATAKAIGVDSRRLGKTINFAAIYGAQPKRIAQTAGISIEEAEQALDEYWKKLPKASAWIKTEKYKAKQKGGVKTLLGRFIPLPGLYSKDKYDRWHWERVAINAIIQGSASEIIKLAMLAVDAHGYLSSLSVHDEIVFSLKEDVKDKLKKIMENVIELDVPLEVTGGYGRSWKDAK